MSSPLHLRLNAYTTLPRDDMQQLETVTRGGGRDVPARRDIISEGDRPRAAILVQEGWACRYKALPDGRRQIVGFSLPGDLCDTDTPLLRAMDHSIGTITACRIVEVSRDTMERVLVDRPRLTRALTWDKMVTLATQREWTLNIGQRTAIERLAHLLCELFLRLATVGLANGTRCDFPLTQADLADATGLTPVHVNRTLQELRRRDLLELRSRRLMIPDLAALKEVAYFNDNYLHLDQEAMDTTPTTDAAAGRGLTSHPAPP